MLLLRRKEHPQREVLRTSNSDLSKKNGGSPMCTHGIRGGAYDSIEFDGRRRVLLLVRQTYRCVRALCCLLFVHLFVYVERQPLDEGIREKRTHAHHSPLQRGGRQSVRVSPDRRYSIEVALALIPSPGHHLCYCTSGTHRFSAAEDPLPRFMRCVTRSGSVPFGHLLSQSASNTAITMHYTERSVKINIFDFSLPASISFLFRYFTRSCR
ncbi:hypothetical protein GHT06_020813 [Daphnia sinensis]|uniref:Uncharacterized protein n=1 Tax=Daphnia sinensis TaxID=1820382 RepID=A0AAD5PQ99_9CRUS|nr:hypothetical protein GHT06_020813 [Daphnia sinensis]